MDKLSFSEIKDLKQFLKENNSKREIFNFINSHDLYFFARDTNFRNTFNENSINSIDGFTISLFLSLKKFRNIGRFTGPDFTKQFFENQLIGKEKQLFIGLKDEDLGQISKKYPYLDRKNLFCYNPPYIKSFEFADDEINKMAQLINSKNINYIWVGLGCPKQNFLTDKLFQKTKAQFFFNVGAGLDFLLEKKRRAPKIFSSLGLEWFYRLITDFNHSKKKVLRSLSAIIYLRYIK
jgi:N-acetylglucosaminyldiphosphoundecaprenol N-acetyl-beta-D-mannosaminyltransferase